MKPILNLPVPAARPGELALAPVGRLARIGPRLRPAPAPDAAARGYAAARARLLPDTGRVLDLVV